MHRALEIGTGCGKLLLLCMNHAAQIDQPGFIRMAIKGPGDRKQRAIEIPGLDGRLNCGESAFQIRGLTLCQRRCK